ncbi:MAG: haloacid dehalogenase [Deltaproteobacteria bacterium]|nr:MAG: haloacid dehalogenase [Deltaproteobacteria bacterium]
MNAPDFPVAFDMDGVFADTMGLFLTIAREAYGLSDIRYEDITSYDLVDCLAIEEPVMNAIIEIIISGDYPEPLHPMPGAVEGLRQIIHTYGKVLFVTARPKAAPLETWMASLFPDQSDAIQLIPAGSFEAKAGILNAAGKTIFVEDRLETCFDLADAGITPIVFRQPWNRRPHDFHEVGGWEEILPLIDHLVESR